MTKNRTEGDLIAARHIILERMKEQGIVPKHQVLDNEISKSYKAEIRTTGMTYQLALLDNQRHNISEKEIHTWKYHLVGVMRGTEANFPTHLWCQAVPQAERQLIIIRQANVHPAISAYAYVNGPHD